MSAIAEPVIHASDDRLARRNAMVLAVAQALAGGNNIVIFASASIVGSVLAPTKGLATLPITAMVVGMWLGTLPVGALARRFGRRFALLSGTGFGMLSGFISYSAVMSGNFWLLMVGTFCGGLYAAAHQSYRFAAADTASEHYRPKVVSLVLAGGVFSAVLGPQLVIFTKDLLSPYTFAASYLGQSACALLAALVVMFVKIPPLSVKHLPPGRPLAEIVRTPKFIVAVTCGIVSYTTMNLVMTAAPLAMVDCGHSVTQATLGIQWHVLAMFGPSFITGSLIARFGIARITGIGLALHLRHRHRRHHRHHRRAFLDRARLARRRLEPLLHRRHHHGDAMPPAGGAQQGAGLQRFPHLRLPRPVLLCVGAVARRFRLGLGERGDVPHRADRVRAARLARLRQARSDGVRRGAGARAEQISAGPGSFRPGHRRAACAGARATPARHWRATRPQHCQRLSGKS